MRAPNYALTQAQESQASTSDTVLSDVGNAYEALRSNDEVVQLYTSGYLKEAQDSRDISEYAYKRGATSVLDFLDAERSNRATQLAYRQALSSYMTAARAAKRSRWNKEPSVKMRNHLACRMIALTALSADLAGASPAVVEQGPTTPAEPCEQLEHG